MWEIGNSNIESSRKKGNIKGNSVENKNIIKNKIPNVEDMKLQVELLRKELQTEV